MSPTGWGHLSLGGIVQSASLLLLARGAGITPPRILNTWPAVATNLWRFVALTRAWENLRIREIGSPAIRLAAAGN